MNIYDAEALYQDAVGKLRQRLATEKVESITLQFFNEIAKPTSKPWLIKNVMARGEISSWIAPPGKGKSALLTDIAVHLGGSPAWREYRVKEQAGVIYFAMERANLVKQRLAAYKLRDGFHDLPIAVAGQIVDLMDKDCVNLIEDAIKRAEDRFERQVGLVIFDTWSKGIAAGRGDENQARDQNIALANLRRVIDRQPVHISTIGHTGKDEKKGQRGSNAKQADDDVEVQISGDEVKTVIVTKANDQPQGELTGFRLEPYDFGADEDGDPIRAFILSKEVLTGGAIDRALSPRQQLAIEALDEALLNHGRPAPGGCRLPTGTKVIAEGEWMTELTRRRVIDPKASNPRARYTELRDRLNARKKIGVCDDLVWK